MTRRQHETTDAYHERLAAEAKTVTSDQPQAVPDLEKLRKLAEAAAKVAPCPWEAEGEEIESGYGKHDEFVIFDANGLRLCGTENADTSFGSISEENDGDGGHYQWNEPARVLMHFIAACDPATIISLLAAPPILPVETPAASLTDEQILDIAVTHSNCKDERGNEIFSHLRLIEFARHIAALVVAPDTSAVGIYHRVAKDAAE